MDHLHAEAIVIVTGLRSRPELNGKRGRIVGRDATTFRFKVQIEGEPGPLWLKPDNLMAPSRDRPRDVMGDEAEEEKFDAQALSHEQHSLPRTAPAGAQDGRLKAGAYSTAWWS